MDFLIPIIGAVLQAGSLTIDKVVLSIRNVNYKNYIGIGFPIAFLITLAVFFIFRPTLSFRITPDLTWIFILAVVAITLGNNFFYYRALKVDALNEMQIISLLQQIPAIIFSALIFSSERNPIIIVFALIASLAIIWSHFKRHHFSIAKKTFPYLIWSLTLAPLMAPLSREILFRWDPVSFQLIRVGLAALIVWPLFAKEEGKLNQKAFWLIIALNCLSTIGWLLLYVSYERFGVIYTTLIFSLQPLLVYFASVFLLKEKLEWKKAAAFILVLGSIVAAQAIG